MDAKIICKTMICVYKELEKRCELIDDTVIRRAVNSAHRNIYETVDELIDLINEKRTYCNVKVIIDEALEKMSDKSAIEKYILGVNIKDIEKDFNSERTMYRHLSKQKEELYQIIINKYEIDKLIEIISDSNWLMNKYREFKELEKRGCYNYEKEI